MIQKYYIQDIDDYKRKSKKKNSLKIKADNAFKSLKEVEYFLGNWKKVSKGIKLYKILK